MIYNITTQTVPWDSLKNGDIINCPYTGHKIEATLPAGSWKLECWGAQCGKIGSSHNLGFGGYIRGILKIDEAKPIYLYTGGQGKTTPSSTVSAGTTVEGGWNGGGTVYVVNAETGHQPTSGGGASDIRIGTDSLYARVIVAGGGGGTSQNNVNTYCVGGGFAGRAKSAPAYNDPNTTRPTYGMSCGATLVAPGKGVSAKYDGSFGKGGDSYSYSSSNYYMGSGGGGWYGGGGSSNSSTGESGGSNQDTVGAGGSSYGWCEPLSSFATSIDGWLLEEDTYLQDVYTINGGDTSTAASQRTYAENPGAVIKDGTFPEPDGSTTTYGHQGNGYIRITKTDPLHVKLNGIVVL